MAQETAERTDPKEQLLEQMTNGIKSFADTEKFKNWLESGSRLFHNNYSFQNALLVWLQRPDASYVMGYETWKTYGRQVKRDAQGIKIIKPVMAGEGVKGGLFQTINKGLDAQFSKDPSLKLAVYRLGSSRLEFTKQRENGLLGLRENGRELHRFKSPEDCRKFIDRAIIGKVPLYFNVTTVFDAKDVVTPEYLWVKSGYKKEELALDEKGEPVKNGKGEYKIINSPERQARLVTELDLSIDAQEPTKMEVLLSALQKTSESKGIPMRFERRDTDEVLNGGAKGYFHRPAPGEAGKGFIVIDKDLPITEQAAVALHEMAHSDLHGNLRKLEEQLGEKADRGMKEIQAEAAAFMTAKSFGIDTGTSSFGYLAAYSKGYEIQDLQKSFEIIYAEGKALLSDIRKELDASGYNLDLTPKDSLMIDEDIINDIHQGFVNYANQKEAAADVITKEIAGLAAAEKTNYKLSLLRSMGINIGIRKEDIAIMRENAELLLNCKDRAGQDTCIFRLEAAEQRIKINEGAFGPLMERFQEMYYKPEKEGMGMDEWNKAISDRRAGADSRSKDENEASRADERGIYI